jgi:hypothetical protein
MSFPILKDQWKYDEKESESFLQRSWWSRAPQPITFELVGEPGDEQVFFVEKIAICILEAIPESVTVKGKSRIVEFNAKKLDNERWCAVAFIECVDVSGAINASSIAISFTPKQNSIIEHLAIWVAFRLWD